MEKQSVYIETTVVSWVTARPSQDLIVAAHQRVMVEWWKNAPPLLEPFVLPVVIEEAQGEMGFLRKRNELLTTETELMAMAAAANTGFKSIPKKGYSAPAAIGIPRLL